MAMVAQPESVCHKLCVRSFDLHFLNISTGCQSQDRDGNFPEDFWVKMRLGKQLCVRGENKLTSNRASLFLSAISHVSFRPNK